MGKLWHQGRPQFKRGRFKDAIHALLHLRIHADGGPPLALRLTRPFVGGVQRLLVAAGVTEPKQQKALTVAAQLLL